MTGNIKIQTKIVGDDLYMRGGGGFTKVKEFLHNYYKNDIRKDWRKLEKKGFWKKVDQ